MQRNFQLINNIKYNGFNKKKILIPTNNQYKKVIHGQNLGFKPSGGAVPANQIDKKSNKFIGTKDRSR